MQKLSTTVSGRSGESTAVTFLKSFGYKIIDLNFRSKFGEIDIIAIDIKCDKGQDVLVFVEVKTRWSNYYGSPEEAVTPFKIRSIIKTADYYKLLNPHTPALQRIDVIAIEAHGGDVVDIRHIKNVTG